MSCPVSSTAAQYPYTAEWTCAGGSFSARSNDGSTVISGIIGSGLFTLQETVSGGITHYHYVFSANFSGGQSLNGKSAAVVGAVLQPLADLTAPLDPAKGTIQSGLIDLSQQYEPAYIADTGNNRIVQTSDIVGSNWISLGTPGSGVKQFSSPWGIALDKSGRVYVSDSGNCRIVRMSSITGASWTSFGGCGSGNAQFSDPKGVWVDSAGKIYVADSGNNRVVRMDNMIGANFTTLGNLGNGVRQFNNPSAVTTDAAGKIYVADSTNARIAQFSDMNGTNWATLQFPVGYLTPDGIGVDASKRIYVTDSLQSQAIRVDNISGANQVTLSIDQTNYAYDISKPTGVFVDPDGAVYLADTNNNRVLRFYDFSFDDIFAMGTSGSGLGNLSKPHGVVGLRETAIKAIAAVTPASQTFPIELKGTASSPQKSVLTNIGTAPMTVSGATSSTADFPLTHNCPATLVGGQNCAASIIFKPTAGGVRKGKVTFATSVGNEASNLTGSGVLTAIAPKSLVLFEGQTGIVTVTNPLNTATSVKSVTTTGQFSATSNCGALPPGASCTIVVSYNYVGYVVLGTLAMTDSSGVAQYVSLTGE